MACFIHPRLLPVIMIHHIVIIVIINHHHYLGDNWNIINNYPGTSFHIVVIIIINHHYYLGNINISVDCRCDDDSWGDISDQEMYEPEGWPLLLWDYPKTHATDNDSDDDDDDLTSNGKPFTLLSLFYYSSLLDILKIMDETGFDDATASKIYHENNESLENVFIEIYNGNISVGNIIIIVIIIITTIVGSYYFYYHYFHHHH